MIESSLARRRGSGWAADSDLTPLPIDETVASLSAILLDTPYYALLKAS